MAITRKFSNEDCKVFDEFTKEMENRMEFSETAGTPGKANIDYMLALFDQNPSFPVKIETLRDWVTRFASNFTFISAQQAEFNTVVAGLTNDEAKTINDWFGHQHWLLNEGESGQNNLVMVTRWLRDRKYPITDHNLNLAVSNAQMSGRRAFAWRPSEEKFQGGRHSNAKPADFSDYRQNAAISSDEKVTNTDRTYVGGLKNHALDAPSQTASPKSKNDYWEAKAKAVIGNTHSYTAMLQRMLVTDSTGAVDWKQTYEKRTAMVNGTQTKSNIGRG